MYIKNSEQLEQECRKYHCLLNKNENFDFQPFICSYLKIKIFFKIKKLEVKLDVHIFPMTQKKHCNKSLFDHPKFFKDLELGVFLME